MIDESCPHFIDGNCQIATEIAGQPIGARAWACAACVSCDTPRARNEFTIGLAKSQIQKVAPLKPRPKLHGPDKARGPGTVLLSIMPTYAKVWSSLTLGGCGCKNYARKMDRLGNDQCSEPSRFRVTCDHLVEQAGKIPEIVLGKDALYAEAARLVNEAIRISKREFCLPEHKDVRLTIKENKFGFASAFQSPLGSAARFVTVADLNRDVVKLASMIPPDVTAIAGVARSGLSVATMLSMLTHLPMCAIRQTKNDVIDVGNGWRLGGHKHIDTRRDKVLVVDDTVMTGNSLRAIEHLLDKQFSDYITAAVYVNPLATLKPDLWVHDLPWPHLLEWNFANSVLSPNLALDFDGVICHDPDLHADDDGPRYLDFLENARPKYLFRKDVVPLIVTARMEKYRPQTEAWLKKHGIRFKKLVMHPADTPSSRWKDGIEGVARYKAEHFQQWARQHKASPPPLGFVESDDAQAKIIHDVTGLMVVCPTTAKVHHQKPIGKNVTIVVPSVIKQEPINKNSDRLVIAVAGGRQSHEQAKISAPRMRAYASKCGADFVLLTGDQKPDWPLYNKFRISQFLSHYKQTLYLDVDVLIQDHASSIFDAVPRGVSAAMDEFGLVENESPSGWLQQETIDVCHSQGIEYVERTTMPNTGIVLFASEHAHLYEPPTLPFPSYWCFDQDLLDIRRIHSNANWMWLDPVWHHSFLSPNFFDEETARRANFIHFNGSGPQEYRIELMTRFASGNYTQLLPPNQSQWSPSWIRKLARDSS